MIALHINSALEVKRKCLSFHQLGSSTICPPDCTGSTDIKGYIISGALFTQLQPNKWFVVKTASYLRLNTGCKIVSAKKFLLHIQAKKHVWSWARYLFPTYTGTF